MSWLFSRALVEAFSQVTMSDEELSAPLSVMPTQHRFSRLDKTMDHSRLSRFGLTCAVLTRGRGEELLTAFLRGFRAKTYPLPEEETASTVSEAGSGTKLYGSLASYCRTSSTWKTAQCSLLGGSDEFLETWPSWGTTRNGELYPRPQPALPTYAREYGFVPTPVASMHKGSSTGSLTRKNGRDRTRDRLDHFIFAHHGGHPNPEWVEWLMGWPIGWTDLKPLETARSPSAPHTHGESCQEACE